MIDPVTSLAGATGIGVGVGSVINIFQFLASLRIKKQQVEYENNQKLVAISTGRIKEYNEQADKPTEVENPHYSPRQWVVPACAGMLCISFCYCVALWAKYPSERIWSWKPDGDPNTVEAFFGFISIITYDNGIYELTTGGACLGLLHGVLLLLGTFTTGKIGR